MSPEILLSLAGLAIAGAWTPGPNNVLVASSGARFGFRKTLPHIAGVGIGFPFMIFCIALGLGQVFQQSALFRDVLSFVGIMILLWFAWKIGTASGGIKEEAVGRPFTFLESAAFQWVNPKSWAMAIALSAQYVSESSPVFTAMIVASVFVFVGFGSASTWTLFGTAMQRWLTSPLRLRVFNVTMALAVVVSVALIIFSGPS